MGSGVTFEEVQGVAALNIRSQSSHFFECDTSEGIPQHLQWESKGRSFPTEITTDRMNLRLDLADVTNEDSGVYTCVNTITNESLSINITGGD